MHVVPPGRLFDDAILRADDDSPLKLIHSQQQESSDITMETMPRYSVFRRRRVLALD